jgi:Protein of unknown function (DUF559)
LAAASASCILVTVVRTAFTPQELTQRPFTVAEARRAGLKRWNLEGNSWVRLGAGIYVWSGLAADKLRLLQAVGLRLPASAAFSGFTAAWLHGLDVTPDKPLEVILPRSAGVSARAGVNVRRADVYGEVVTVRGFRTTSIERTLLDLCARLSLTEAVMILDMALHAQITALDAIVGWASGRRNRRGVPKLTTAANHAEPLSESPMESRLRMLLVLAGLPRPEAQVKLFDAHGEYLGRPDLYYRNARLGLEYDGQTHRVSLEEDNRRQNRLLNAGIRLLRFTAGDIHKTPQVVAAQVRAELFPAVAGSIGPERPMKPAVAGSFRNLTVAERVGFEPTMGQ